jgi:hypothetical protein
MRKSKKYFIKKLSLELTRQVFIGVEKFLKDSYFKKRLENQRWQNVYFATLKLGEMLLKVNTRRRILFKIPLQNNLPMYVEFNPKSDEMGCFVPDNQIRINLANIHDYLDLRTTIIHELTHLFDERDVRNFENYSYDECPFEIRAREMEKWFVEKFSKKFQKVLD